MSILGVVNDCPEAIIYESPSENSEVLSVIPCLTEVMIDEYESTDYFYKICTATSVEGYCDKNYIAVQP